MSSEPQSTRQSPLPDQDTTYPLETMTTEQREIFGEYLRSRQKSRLNIQEPISVARLLVDHKPGVNLSSLTMPSIVDYEPSVSVQDVAEVFDLEYKIEDGNTLMARSSWLLDVYPSSGEVPTAATRRAGAFLGYPQADINHFLHSEPPNITPIAYIEKGIFSPEEMAFTKFLPQRHEDTIEGYERAITTGREIWILLTRYSNRWDLPKLNDYLDWIFDSALEKFAGNEFEYQWI